MLTNLLGRTISKFINSLESVTATDSLNIVAKKRGGSTKAIRDITDEHELTVDFSEGKVEEKYTVKQKPKRVIGRQKQEIRAANRFLPAFNNKNDDLFEIAPNQPSTDSHIDILIVGVDTKRGIGLQIRVSDDEPWKELKEKGMFQRLGLGFELHHSAIKRAIQSKLKYPTGLRRDLILLLDGWLGVRQEDLEEFRKAETNFLKNVAYREIWFVGGSAETIVRLYP